MRTSRSASFVSSAVLVSLALVLGACGDDDDDAADDGASSGVTKLTVCSDTPYPPFEFQDDDGKDVGYDIDIIRAIAEGAEVDFEVLDVPFEGILANLTRRHLQRVVALGPVDHRRAQGAGRLLRAVLLSDQSPPGAVRRCRHLPGPAQPGGADDRRAGRPPPARPTPPRTRRVPR